MNPVNSGTRKWWGAFALEVDEPRRWALGPLRLQILRLAGEVRVIQWHRGGPLDDTCEVAVPTRDAPPEDAVLERFGFEQSPDVLHVTPALADRAVVTQPEDPFRIPARENATIYVSTPLWIQLRTRADGPVFFEKAIAQPSDSWFGPNTRVGELCYAARTAARINLENVPARAQRAVSAVRVHNASAERLDLDRLKLPVPLLSLHASGDGHLWTEKVSLRRAADGDAAELQLSDETPVEAGTTERVQSARQRASRGDLLRVFGRMIGRGGQHV